MIKNKTIKFLIYNVEYLYKLGIREIFLSKKENSEATKERHELYSGPIYIVSLLSHEQVMLWEFFFQRAVLKKKKKHNCWQMLTMLSLFQSPTIRHVENLRPTGN